MQQHTFKIRIEAPETYAFPSRLGELNGGTPRMKVISMSDWQTATRTVRSFVRLVVTDGPHDTAEAHVRERITKLHIVGAEYTLRG